MAQIAGKPPTKSSGILSQILSYVFDVRFLGVLGQIAFIVLVVFAFQTIAATFASNADKLGESQFICRDGRFRIVVPTTLWIMKLALTLLTHP